MISRLRLVWITVLAAGLFLLMLWVPRPLLQNLAVGVTAHRSLVMLLALFCLVTLSLIWSAGHRLDVGVFLYFNLHRLRAPWIDRWMWVLTQIGNGILGFSGAAILYALSFRQLAFIMAIGIMSLWLAVELVKAIIGRIRPYRVLDAAQVIGFRERGRSFPSGHTAQTFFLAALLSQYFQLGVWTSLPLYALAGLVGFTRVYVGVHYPRDVLAGAILGTIWGMMTALSSG